MSPKNTIRAWKDEDYRSSLGEGERASLLRHPAGLIELSDPALEGAAGAASRVEYCSGTMASTCVF